MKQGVLNIVRRLNASVLTVFGILIGICSVVVIDHLGKFGVEQVSGELSDVGVIGISVKRNSKAGFGPLGEEELEAIHQLEGVNSALPVLGLIGEAVTAGKSSQIVCWGSTQGDGQIFRQTLLHGRLLESFDLTQDAEICLADENFAMEFFGRKNIVGKEVTVSLTGGTKTLKVVGVVQSGGAITQSIIGSFVPYFLYLPYPVMLDCSGGEGFTQICVDLEGWEQEETLKRFEQQLELKTGQTQGFLVDNIKGQTDRIEKILQILQQVLTAIAGTSLLVSGLSIMLVMSNSVRERTSEIGIKKALGATHFDIGLEFLSEAVLLTLLGGVLGCVAGISLILLGGWLFHLSITIRWWEIFASLLFCLFMGGVFGLIPSLRAAKLPPCEALRRK